MVFIRSSAYIDLYKLSFQFNFQGTPECEKECSDSFAISWDFFPPLDLSYPTLRDFLSFFFIMFYFVLLLSLRFEACSFLIRDRKRVDLDLGEVERIFQKQREEKL